MLAVKNQETIKFTYYIIIQLTLLRYKFTLAYQANYIQGMTEMTGRRGRKLLNNLKKRIETIN
jgi:hypothetical protein